MGRPSGFDRGDVLDRAMDAFWRTGYNATSIPELEVATGLGRGSIYNAFGDKEGLFVEVLERYVERHAAPPFVHLAHDDPREAIRLTLHAIVDRMDHARLPSGCLLANTTIECDAIGPKIRTMLRAGERRLERAFAETVARGIARNQLPKDTDADALGRYFAVIVQGIAAVHRATRDADRLRQSVELAMLAWPAPTAPATRGRAATGASRGAPSR